MMAQKTATLSSRIEILTVPGGDDSASSRPEPASGELLVLAGILIIAAAVRLPGLWLYPLEQDELYTIIESQRLFGSPLRPGIEARPFYYLLQHALFTLVPANALGIRLLPVAFGLLGVVATWALARTVVGRTAGLAAALFATLSPWHMYVSGLARYGSLLYLLSALFALFLLRGVTKECRRDYLIAFLCLLAGSVTHPSFVFTAAGVVAAALLVRNDGSLRPGWPTRLALTHLWAPYAACMLLGLGLLWVTGEQSSLRNFNGRGLQATLRLGPALVDWITPVLTIAAGAGVLTALRESAEARTRQWSMMVLLGVTSTFSAILLASFVTDVYADYGISVLPLVCAAAGGFVQLLTSSSGQRPNIRSLSLAALIVAAMLPSTVSHLSDGTRFDPRPAFAMVARLAPEARVLTTPIALQRHYASQLNAKELRYERPFLDRELAENGEFWLVAAVQRYGIVFDDAGVGPDWLSTNCRQRLTSGRPRLDYRMYSIELYQCKQQQLWRTDAEGR
jgi:4-amino-4-deoxy-L-arabinose transferase-like glycosyltransferase